MDGGCYLHWSTPSPHLDLAGGGGCTYLGWGKGVPTLERGGGTYLGQGEGLPILGTPSPHPDLAGGRGYLPWMGEGVPTLDGWRGYLPWVPSPPHPDLAGGEGTYIGVPPPCPDLVERYLPWMGRVHLHFTTQLHVWNTLSLPRVFYRFTVCKGYLIWCSPWS